MAMTDTAPTRAREVYKGRRLRVKPGRSSGYLDSYVNDVPLGSSITRDADAELRTLRAWVDAADERRLTEPDAYPAHWYEGA